MKNKTASIFLFLMISVYFHSAGQVTKSRVLFLGNSYTYVNDLPTMLFNMAQSMGDALLRAQSTPGGYSLEKHTTNATTLAKIQQGNWDVVVLQEGAGVFMNYPHRYNTTFAITLDQEIKKYNPNCTTMVFLTWGRKYGCCPALPCNGELYSSTPECTYRGQDSVIHKFTMIMADTLKASIAPVGVVWRYLTDNHPGIELYNADLNHPSVAGTYAAACCFYTVLFKKDPTTLPYNPGLSEATIIKEAVKLLVYDSLAQWRISTSELPVSNPDYSFLSNQEPHLLYPTFATNTLTLCNLKPNSTLSILSASGKFIKRMTINCFKAEFRIDDLSPGLYFLKIECGKTKSIQRFVKN